ncbi:MAG: aspartate kinase, partial [Planctomycetota bacterium]
MPILVQKFGGTSVADAARIHLAARRAIRAKLSGRQVVLVVSAMGHTTDHLIDLANQVSRKPSRREMDMLISTGEQVSIALMAMAIHEAGHEAVSMTGAQAGMLTDSAHTRARIRSIDARRLKEPLDQGKIVIVAGFQGVDSDFNITTLGRGGSDTTAVALAAALQAEVCEIFTDVDGIYTTDPRIVPEARKIGQISYEEMLELASAGAGVMHGRSIEIGKKFGVPIHVRSSFSDTAGTMIMSQTAGMEDVVVRAASIKRDVARVTLVGMPPAKG